MTFSCVHRSWDMFVVTLDRLIRFYHSVALLLAVFLFATLVLTEGSLAYHRLHRLYNQVCVWTYLQSPMSTRIWRHWSIWALKVAGGYYYIPILMKLLFHKTCKLDRPSFDPTNLGTVKSDYDHLDYRAWHYWILLGAQPPVSWLNCSCFFVLVRFLSLRDMIVIKWRYKK